MASPEENISAFTALQIIKEQKGGKKKKKRLMAAGNLNQSDVKNLLLHEKRKEIHMNNSNSCPEIKKRKKLDASDEEKELWKDFCKLNPQKKLKQNRKNSPSKNGSIFSNCKVTEKQDNIFFSNGTNGKPKKIKNKKTQFLVNSTMFEENNSPFSVPDISHITLESTKKSKKSEISDDTKATHCNNGLHLHPLEPDALNVLPKKLKKKKNIKSKQTLIKGDSVVKSNILNEDPHKNFQSSPVVPSNSRISKNSNELLQKHPKDKLRMRSQLTKCLLNSSIEVGKEVFSWLISPIEFQEFFADVWEKQPLHISRGKVDFFESICTMEDINSTFNSNKMYFTKNVDVTSYVDGERFTENPEGRARASIVWELFREGKSIRILNPQTFIPKVHALTSTLQEFFRCFVGANIYLTPAGTQGFAPHYDDIEAFVLQLDGEKLWKIYKPRFPEEVLPRLSSQNFKEEEIGEPIMEVTLKPGDLLYFPRGFIHQAKCLPEIHSLHITVSCYQKNSWADLLEKVIPAGLEKAIEEDEEFRQGLPLNYLCHLGLVNSDSSADERIAMLKTFKKLMKKMIDFCPVDAAVDQLAKGFIHDAMPPCLSKEEIDHNSIPYYKETSLSEILDNYSEKPLGIKLIRANVLRLVSEGDDLKVYYTTDNGKEYHSEEPKCLYIPEDWAEGIDTLIHNYPNFTLLKDLSVSQDWSEIIQFVLTLWERGLLLFDKPLSEL